MAYVGIHVRFDEYLDNEDPMDVIDYILIKRDQNENSTLSSCPVPMLFCPYRDHKNRHTYH